jgi:hypothetical protein
MKRTSRKDVKISGIVKSSFLLLTNSTTKYRPTLSFCRAVVRIEPHHMGKFQLVPLVCCGEKQERRSQFVPSQGPEGLGLTLIDSRSMKKRAMEEILGNVGVLVPQSVPYRSQPHTILTG